MGIGVGEFGRATRRTIRSPINPLDKSTIVSVYPKSIHEEKCTIEPGIFDIEAAPSNDFTILVVGPSSWWKDVDPEQPLLEITNGSIQVADSVIKDYANGLFMCNMGDAMPGLFFLPGEHNKPAILTRFKEKLDQARGRQKKWYEKLVTAGDILWARSNGNPLSISDDMRLAAQELQLKEKPWLRDFTTLQMINCKFCGSLGRPGFPVCATCNHVIDEALYNQMKGLDKKVS